MPTKAMWIKSLKCNKDHQNYIPPATESSLPTATPSTKHPHSQPLFLQPNILTPNRYSFNQTSSQSPNFTHYALAYSLTNTFTDQRISYITNTQRLPHSTHYHYPSLRQHKATARLHTSIPWNQADNKSETIQSGLETASSWCAELNVCQIYRLGPRALTSLPYCALDPIINPLVAMLPLNSIFAPIRMEWTKQKQIWTWHNWPQTYGKHR